MFQFSGKNFMQNKIGKTKFLYLELSSTILLQKANNEYIGNYVIYSISLALFS